jgi:hypothetical protein
VQAAHELRGHAGLAVRKGADLARALGHPAEPLGQAPDVRVDGIAGPLQAEEDDAGGRLGPDAVILHQLVEGRGAVQCSDVLQGERVGILNVG